MKNNTVIKWALLAVIILVLIIGAYSLYDTKSGKPSNEHMGHNSPKTSEHGNHGEHNDDKQTQSDIEPIIQYSNGIMNIELQNETGERFDKLEINHEKLMHLIIVSDDLKQYYHLHPKKTEKGKFEVSNQLNNGNYKAFIDIKPKNKDYIVKPLLIEVGTDHAHNKAALKPETNFSKTVGEYTVTMTPDTFNVKEPITLNFSFNKGIPQPYLGALGHVVILDEKGEKYVHVHPVSDKEAKFETRFDKAGVYKIWGEFKFNDKVNVYPFVIEVK